jgi:type VI secretion system protein ImpH
MAEIPDLALAYYAGLLAHRPRSAIGLQLLLGDFFGVPVQVQQFRGQWARLENSDRSRLIRGLAGHCKLGEDAVLGERVWESESQFRICVGPVDLPQFEQYLPDRGAPSNKTFFLLCHLTRFYVGPSLEFDVQMILAPESVPMTRLGGSDASRHSAETRGGEASPGGGLVPAASASAAPAEGPKASLGPRLGWNTWIYNRPPTGPASDAIFAGRELFWSNDDARTSSPLQAT